MTESYLLRISETRGMLLRGTDVPTSGSISLGVCESREDLAEAVRSVADAVDLDGDWRVDWPGSSWLLTLDEALSPRFRNDVGDEVGDELLGAIVADRRVQGGVSVSRGLTRP